MVKKNKEIVEELQLSLIKYEKEKGFDGYSRQTLIKDIIYFLGTSIDKQEYEYAQGFRKFCKEVSKSIAGETTNPHT